MIITTFILTGEKDSDGNEYYVYTAPDGQEAKIAMKNETTNYYQADVAQKGYTEYTDNDGIVYRSNEKGNYTGSDGKTYKLENNTFTEIDRKKKLRQLTVMEIQHCLIQPVQQIY